MYAVIQTGGKQYRVSEGDVLKVERLGVEEGATVELDKVLMVVDGEQVMVGSPTVEGAVVTATVLDKIKGQKVRTFKYNGSKYRRRRGHRQQYTRLQVNDIVVGSL